MNWSNEWPTDLTKSNLLNLNDYNKAVEESKADQLANQLNPWPSTNEDLVKSEIIKVDTGTVTIRDTYIANFTPNPTIDPEGFVQSLEDKLGWNEAATEAAVYGQSFTKDEKHIPLSDIVIGVDLAIKPDTISVVIGKVSDGKLIITESLTGAAARAKIEEYNNVVPTHDPYTNPDMLLYHECACGAILDPNTKSFAQLNNAASYLGWKIRWGDQHYQAYCVKCGEGVE